MPNEVADSTPEPEVMIKNGGLKSPRQKTLFFLIFFGLLILGAFTLLHSFKIITLPFLNKVSPSAENVLVASFQDEKIYTDDLRTLAAKQYAENAIDNKVLKLTLENLIEEKILKLEARKLNIPEATSTSLLKSEVIKKSLDSREAFVVSVWVPSDEYIKTQGIPEDQIEEAYELREEIKKAFAELEGQIKNNVPILEAARSIYEKYPSLQTRLAFNGYILEKTKDEKILSTPKLYTLEDKKRGEAFFEFLFSLEEGAVKMFIQPNGSGGSVVQVVSVHKGANNDYAKWLEEKKEELVKIYNQL